MRKMKTKSAITGAIGRTHVSEVGEALSGKTKNRVSIFLDLKPEP